jgi:formylglycine-generating enzyme required for sulfatase activity
LIGAAAAFVLLAIGYQVLPSLLATQNLERAKEHPAIVGSSPPPQTQSKESARTPAPSSSALPDMVLIHDLNIEVSRTEVTYAQWDACRADGGCKGYRPRDSGRRGNYPVVFVGWHDAQAYVEWLNTRPGARYRLLTSDEWEFAARAGEKGKRFSWGDDEPDPACGQRAHNGANFDQCGVLPMPVKSFPPNRFGLFDMHGNVYEWVEDCYDPSCSARVIRSGSFRNDSAYLSSSYRGSYDPDGGDRGRIDVIGFRVARERGS